jgi:hypothetical protein
MIRPLTSCVCRGCDEPAVWSVKIAMVTPDGRPLRGNLHRNGGVCNAHRHATRVETAILELAAQNAGVALNQCQAVAVTWTLLETVEA